jgi:WD40 repeat protein
VSVTFAETPPAIVSVEPSSGDIVTVASGSAPAASEDGRVAYTDADGRLTIRRIDGSDTPQVVGKFAVSGVLATWSHDGRLGFVSGSPPGTPDPTVSVVIVATNGTRTELPVEGRHFGSHSIAWSPNGGQLAVGLSPNEVRVIDSTNGQTLQHYDGVDGKFSPTDDATIAMLVYDSSSGSKAARLNVYHDGDLIVSHDLGHLSRPAFDWSPDGTRIVAAMDDSVGIWNVADNTFKKFSVTSGDQKIFGDVMWVST